MAARVFLIVLHHGVTRAELSLTEAISLLTTAEIQDYCMACLEHEFMAVVSKSNSTLDVDFRPVVLCKH